MIQNIESLFLFFFIYFSILICLVLQNNNYIDDKYFGWMSSRIINPNKDNFFAYNTEKHAKNHISCCLLSSLATKQSFSLDRSGSTCRSTRVSYTQLPYNHHNKIIMYDFVWLSDIATHFTYLVCRYILMYKWLMCLA